MHVSVDRNMLRSMHKHKPLLESGAQNGDANCLAYFTAICSKAHPIIILRNAYFSFVHAENFGKLNKFRTVIK